MTMGHLYITPKSYGLRVLASTSRFRSKFVTTVYYRPVHVTPLMSSQAAATAAAAVKAKTAGGGAGTVESEAGAARAEAAEAGSERSTSMGRVISS